MKRVTLSFVPRWDTIVQGWTVNFISKNFWRVAGFYDREDLLQEFFIVFSRVRDSYPEVRDAPHFLSLYKRAVSNRMHDLATSRTQEQMEPFPEDGLATGLERVGVRRRTGGESLPMTSRVARHEAEVELELTVDQLPSDVKAAVLTMLRSSPPVYIRSAGGRETTREMVARVTGTDLTMYDRIMEHLGVGV